MQFLNRPWHQSDINNYLTCPALFRFSQNPALPDPGRHPNAVTGSALHWAIDIWHRDHRRPLPRAKSDALISDLFEQTVQGQDPQTQAHLRGPIPPVIWEWSKDDRPTLLQNAQDVFYNYQEQPHNIDAEIIISEAVFSCRYYGITFEGAIDQLRKLPDDSIELWDFKFSGYSPSPAYLARSVQFTLYAFACLRGSFFIRDESEESDEIHVFRFNNLPDRAVWYHLSDLQPYKRMTNGIPAGQIKGDPRRFVTIDRTRIMSGMANIRRIVSAANKGLLFKSPKNAGSCHGFCHYHEACLNDLENLPLDTMREAAVDDFSALL